MGNAQKPTASVTAAPSGALRATFIFVILTSILLIPLTTCDLSQGAQAGWHFAQGDDYWKAGEDKQAEQEFKEALAASIAVKLWGEEANSLVRLAQIYVKQTRDSEAETYFTEALDIFERNQDSSDMKSNDENVRDFWVIALRGKALLLRKHNRTAEATELEARAKTLESKK